MDEINQLLASFRACMATEVLKHRAVKGINQVLVFVKDINAHRDRYKAKLDRLRGSTNAIAECDVVQRQINEIANDEINLARTTGRVELFDVLRDDLKRAMTRN